MVDVKAVKDLIKDYFIECINNKMITVDILEANAEIMKRLEHLNECMWNPVEEFYPSDDRYVLLSFENFTIPQIGRYEESEDGGAFYLVDEDESLVSHGVFVNAWMELPKPYRGE